MAAFPTLPMAPNGIRQPPATAQVGSVGAGMGRKGCRDHRDGEGMGVQRPQGEEQGWEQGQSHPKDGKRDGFDLSEETGPHGVGAGMEGASQ